MDEIEAPTAPSLNSSSKAVGAFFKKTPIQCRQLATNLTRFEIPLHPVIQRVYENRGVTAFDADTYAISRLIPPNRLKGLDQCCALLYEKYLDLQQGKPAKLLVVGDFDVDGATSVVVALRGFRAMGFEIDFFIPDRFKLGYGLSPEVVDAAVPYKPQMLITVDNGIASVTGVAAAQAKGWQVIITDHHLAGDQLPSADAIVNPNQPGCEFPSKNLAGVGVIFYVLIAFRTHLRQQGVPLAQLPHLASLLDIVALGTVADVVPLDENNRRLVSLGLARMRSGQACPGIQALAEVAGRNLAQVSESDLGFAFGPRLNAAGRLEDMSIGVQCLLSDNLAQAMTYANSLDQLNRQRRRLQQDMQAQADITLAAELDSTLRDSAINQTTTTDAAEATVPSVIIAYRADWHQGIVGLVASKLKERWHRPVIAFAKVNETELKGSGRSIPGVHLRDALDVVSKRHPDLLGKFGGHAMAAGLSLAAEQLDFFQAEFEKVIDELITPEMVQQTLVTDGELSSCDLNLDVALALEHAGPWGQAFPVPTFHGDFTVLGCQWLKEKHLKLTLEPYEKSQASFKSIEALYFNVPFGAYHTDANTARALLESLDVARCVYSLQVNRFRGQMRLQCLIDYLEPLA